jgi:hypothetical protein
VGNTPGLQLVFEGYGYLRLTGNIRKLLRTPLSVEYLIHVTTSAGTN